MAFMQPQMFEGIYYDVETENGTFFIPSDVCGLIPNFDVGQRVDSDSRLYRRKAIYRYVADYVDGHHIFSVECCNGVLCRLSAPGYMDCTDWTIHDGDNCEYCQEDEGDTDGDDN